MSETENQNQKRIGSPGGSLSYPLDAFPPLARDVIVEAHADKNICAELLGSAALGAMSLVCQRTTNVRVQSNDPPSPCSLYLLTVAEPHTGKTYARMIFHEAVSKFEELESCKAAAHNEAVEGKLASWKITEKNLSRALSRAAAGTTEYDECDKSLIEHYRVKPRRIKPAAMTFTKATSAGIREMLAENNGAIGIVASDAGAVVNGATFADLPYLSDLWSGEDSRHGLASGSSVIKDPRLTLSLMLQDSEFQRFMKNRGVDAQENGLLSRFLVARASHTVTTSNNLPKERLTAFCDRMNELLHRSMQNPSSERELLTFSEQATTYWQDYGRDLRHQIDRSDWSNGKKYFASRLREHIARIAALFHRIEGQENDVISLDSVYGARKLCDWYLSVYDDVLVPRARRNAQRLREFAIRDHKERRSEGGRFASTEFSNRILIQYGPVRDSTALAAAMRILLDEGDVVKVRSGPKGGDNYDFAPLIRGKRDVISTQVSRSSSRVTNLGWDSD
ncbi:DUF3987 domain-containing protein [Burkholderia gladioli]|uniref:DUF3987 domain-containing protein n=1 Tax=Burkholderia gladioli TaxID=28095 RepID=UPI00163DF7C2|nr:DUF3987 domain-containing protein [Burkholderia gladioli]